MKHLTKLLEKKALHHGGAVVDFIEPVDQHCPMSVNFGVVLCRIHGYREYVTWKYAIRENSKKELILECHHGHYHQTLYDAVQDYLKRVDETRKEVA